MNERIKELAKQAMIFSSKNGGWRISTHVPNDFTEKLAELIIQECINKITLEQDSADQNWQCKNGVHIAHELQKHFGVQND